MAVALPLPLPVGEVDTLSVAGRSIQKGPTPWPPVGEYNAKHRGLASGVQYRVGEMRSVAQWLELAGMIEMQV